MDGGTKKDTGFKPCWEYFNCPASSMKKCPAFAISLNYDTFSDCWFFIKDPMLGGPEKHGPCSECEWNNKYGFFKNGKYTNR